MEDNPANFGSNIPIILPAVWLGPANRDIIYISIDINPNMENTLHVGRIQYPVQYLRFKINAVIH